MRLCQFWLPGRGRRVGVVEDEQVIDVTSRAAGVGSVLEAVARAGTAARLERLVAVDSKGILGPARGDIERQQAEFAMKWRLCRESNGERRSGGIGEAMAGADVCLAFSTSVAGTIRPEWVARMARDAIVFACANPVPEIWPSDATDAGARIAATGRSDFPNQVNNVLCFPYIFRGALDCGARTINEEMKLAAVRAIAGLAREEPSDVAARAYSGETPVFGPDYLIPSPFDPRLILRIAPAVALAAEETGVARRPIADWEAYGDQLNRFIFRSGLIMKPLFSAAKTASRKRVISMIERSKKSGRANLLLTKLSISGSFSRQRGSTCSQVEWGSSSTTRASKRSGSTPRCGCSSHATGSPSSRRSSSPTARCASSSSGCCSTPVGASTCRRPSSTPRFPTDRGSTS